MVVREIAARNHAVLLLLRPAQASKQDEIEAEAAKRPSVRVR